MKKMLIFDMDGTIADLYGISTWLTDIRAEKVDPYINAKTIYNPTEINNILVELKAVGYTIVITSWLAKGSTKEYDNKVRKAKKEWLRKVNFPYDEIHLVKYGTPKAYCTKAEYQILIDDNAEVREQFIKYRKGTTNNTTINAKENIIKELEKLLEKA